MTRKNEISILIPCFNGEQYLTRCLNSIQKQNYPFFEVIILNDGSTDQSLKIIESYLAQDKRFKIVNQTNHGLAFSRNELIKLCNSKYYTFVDADDWLGPNYIQNFIDIISKEEIDLIIASSFLSKNNKNKPYYITKNINSTTTKDSFLSDNALFAWGHLYRKEFIVIYGLYFYDRTSYFEDAGIMSILILKAKNIKFINNPQYYYFINKNSLSRSSINKNKIDSMFAQLNNLYAYLYLIFNNKPYTKGINDILALYHCIIFTSFQFQSNECHKHDRKQYRKKLLQLEKTNKKLLYPKKYWKFWYFVLYRLFVHN